ncbi:MAG: AraC family transcriptional regulator [Acidobacteriota bacterium]
MNQPVQRDDLTIGERAHDPSPAEARALRGAAMPVLDRIRADRHASHGHIARLLGYFESHLFRVGVTLKRLRYACGIRDNSALMSFHRDLGRTPYLYLQDARLTTGVRLLAATSLPAHRISALVGYRSLHVFGRAMTRWCGCGPRRLRQLIDDQLALPKPPHRRHTARRRAYFQLRDRLRQTTPTLAILVADDSPLRPLARRALLDFGAPDTAPDGVLPLPGAPPMRLERTTLERVRAQVIYDSLARRSWDERVALVRAVPFHTPVLFDRLLTASQREGRRSRHGGVELAQLALHSLEAVTGSAHHALAARGWAWLGNARRLVEDYPGAARALTAAVCALDATSRDNALERADLLHIRAALERDRRAFDRALELLRNALGLYRSLGEGHALARALITRATIRRMQRQESLALGDLTRARALLRTVDDPYLKVSLHHELALCLCYTDQLLDAREALLMAVDHASALPELGDLTLRIRWLEGVIAARNDQLDDAIALLRTVYRGFGQLGRPVPAALVALDLAGLYLRAGQPQYASHLLRAALATFDGIEVPGRARQALDLLRAALRTHRHISFRQLQATLGTLVTDVMDPR